MHQNSSKKNSTEYYQETIFQWYLDNGRIFPWRENFASVYQRILVEFLLKRTTASCVAKVYPNFVHKYSYWEKFISVSFNELNNDLKPLGLWNQRSKQLKDFANALKQSSFKFPRSRSEIEALPGVGLYIANAILLFHFKQKHPLLDSNMYRHLSRFYGFKNLNQSTFNIIKVNSYKIIRVPKTIEMNWAILDFSAGVCHFKTPKCLKCPIQEGCAYNKD
jgi:A/G-specific adenine glycosylase